MAVLTLPVVLLKSANAPLAVLSPPFVLLKSAPVPVAVFALSVLAIVAPAPTAVAITDAAVLKLLPSVRLKSEYIPNAELYIPVVRLPRARSPSAVLPPL